MSALQCPARIFVLPLAGEVGPRALEAAVVRLRGERVVGVIASPAAEQYADRVAAALGVQVQVVEDDLDELADRYPGEAVLVIRDWPAAELVALERDADGWSQRPPG